MRICTISCFILSSLLAGAKTVQPPVEIISLLLTDDYKGAYQRSIDLLASAKNKDDSVGLLLGAGYASFYLNHMDTVSMLLRKVKYQVVGKEANQYRNRLELDYFYSTYQLDSAIKVMKDILVEHRSGGAFTKRYYYDLNNFISLCVLYQAQEAKPPSIEVTALLRDDISTCFSQSSALSDSLLLGSMFLNRGLYRYFFEKDTVGSFADLGVSLDIGKRQSYNSLMSDVYSWIGNLYVRSGRVDALEYLTYAKRLDTKLLSATNRYIRRPIRAHNFYNLSLYFTYVKPNLDSAVFYGNLAQSITGNYPSRLRSNLARVMMDVNQHLGDSDAVAYYTEMYLSMQQYLDENEVDQIGFVAKDKERQAAFFARTRSKPLLTKQNIMFLLFGLLAIGTVLSFFRLFRTLFR